MPNLLRRVPNRYLDETNVIGPVIFPIADRLEHPSVEFREAMIKIWALHIMGGFAFDAVKASEDAIQHRDYKVGALAIGHTLDYKGTNGAFFDATFIFSGFNVKKRKYTPELFSIHAEQMLLANAEKIGCESIDGIILNGDPDDHANTGNHPTLHPCASRCVGMLQESELVSASTAIIGVNSTLGVCQMYRASKLWTPGATAQLDIIPDTFSLQSESDKDEFNSKLLKSSFFLEQAALLNPTIDQ